MTKTNKKELARKKRHNRLRNKVFGTGEKPRLCVHRSLNQTYLQLVDDPKGKTIVSLSTLDKNIKNKVKNGGNLEAAKILGEEIAKISKSKGIERIVFDRGGYLYHGRVKAIADSARANGLIF